MGRVCVYGFRQAARMALFASAIVMVPSAFSAVDVPACLESEDARPVCSLLVQLPGCSSEEGRAIKHFERISQKAAARKILVFALVHGDEPLSARAATIWAERLSDIDPRNSWRIVPILNPDGWYKKTRTNARGVDLNRNFPTADWNEQAHVHWEKAGRKNPRRFPGVDAGSESETKCAVAHIEDFRPDFTVALHTPYGMLDFDGPKELSRPKSMLPWVSLGHFPGSLGRYLWHERQSPVLTVEFAGITKTWESDVKSMQDMVGNLALEQARLVAKTQAAK